MGKPILIIEDLTEAGRPTIELFGKAYYIRFAEELSGYWQAEIARWFTANVETFSETESNGTEQNENRLDKIIGWLFLDALPPDIFKKLFYQHKKAIVESFFQMPSASIRPQAEQAT